jgi:hypothetical protein
MDAKFAEALAEVRRVNSPTSTDASPFNENSYLAACTTLVDNRDQLTGRIYFSIPSRVDENNQAAWQHVRDNSESCCDCGRERLVVPANQRTEFAPAASDPVLVKGNRDTGAIYLRPIGSDLAATHAMLWIDESTEGEKCLAIATNPFAPAIDFNQLFNGPAAYSLNKLAEALKGRDKPLIMVDFRTKAPVLAISATDLTAGTASIIPDKDIEILTEEMVAQEKQRQHH